ncbi:hypothetical protein HUG20_10820 [Salicibibacter cibi]|uniref:Thiolase C-terminal domain-containing protein n=1 Tax=Salicibibacter cibi TaxID=2743001 RepID=A0A7T6ZBP0_9BACI|nr:hypothetical protein [Salicibibacter cibi]QQK80335.1 hypothetical protein HUG20_10820 [Salicibibacter cibi]
MGAYETLVSDSLAVIRELGLPDVDVNRNGGTIALGHAFRATGNEAKCWINKEAGIQDPGFLVVRPA